MLERALSRLVLLALSGVARSGNDSPNSAPRSGSASPSPISGHPDLATAGSLAAGRAVARRAGVRHAGEVLHTDLSAALATAEALAHEAGRLQDSAAQFRDTPSLDPLMFTTLA